MTDMSKNAPEFWSTKWPAVPASIKDIKLGVGANALRKAVTAHSGWDAYRASEGIDASQLTAPRMKHAAFILGIDVAAVLAAAPIPEPEAKPVEAPKPVIEQAPIVPPVNPPVPLPRVVQDTPKAPETPKDFAPTGSSGLEAMLANLIGPSILSIVQGDVNAMVQAAIGAMPATVIKVQNGDSIKEVKGLRHPKLALLLRLLAARLPSGNFANVWLSGPAGSGKTTAARQAADALSLEFHHQGSMSMPHGLLGFIDAAGNYHSTSFRKAFEHGGLILLDEIDSGDATVLLALNAALDNGHCTFPDKAVTRHPDFRCIAAANTFGNGATAEYVGRTKLDGAFLNRFHFSIEWNYDAAFEIDACGNAAWAKRVQAARKRAEDAGLKVLITPRHSIAGAAAIAAGFTEDEAAALTYLRGLKPEQIKQVEGL